MVQLLSYIPLINGQLPPNMELFIGRYLSVGAIKIPFRSFPSFIPNPLSLLTAFVTNAFNDRFQLFGFESVSFIWNFAEQLATWLIMLVTYLVLRLLCKYLPQNRYGYSLLTTSYRCLYIRRWKADYEYNAAIRVLMESFLQMTFCAMLNISRVMCF